MTKFDFNKVALQKAQEGEATLDNYFSKWYTIQNVTMAFQKRGIDRIFLAKVPEPTPMAVEYKIDYRARQTGNAYIETVAWDDGSRSKKGWAYTCEADVLAYCNNFEILLLEPLVLRPYLEQWQQKYRTVIVPNVGFNGEGLLIPWRTVKHIAFKALNCEGIQTWDTKN